MIKRQKNLLYLASISGLVLAYLSYYWLQSSGLLGYLLGLSIALFLILVTSCALKLICAIKAPQKLGTFLILFLYVMKLPAMLVAAFVATRILSVALNTFFLGLALVYLTVFSVVYSDAKDDVTLKV